MDLIEYSRRQHSFLARTPGSSSSFAVVTTNPDLSDLVREQHGRITLPELKNHDADAVIIWPLKLSMMYGAKGKKTWDTFAALELAALRGDTDTLLAVKKLMDDYAAQPDHSSFTAEGRTAQRKFQSAIRKALAKK